MFIIPTSYTDFLTKTLNYKHQSAIFCVDSVANGIVTMADHFGLGTQSRCRQGSAVTACTHLKFIMIAIFTDFKQITAKNQAEYAFLTQNCIKL